MSLNPERSGNEAMHGTTNDITKFLRTTRNLFEGIWYITPLSGAEFVINKWILGHANDRRVIEYALNRVEVFLTFAQNYNQKDARLTNDLREVTENLKLHFPDLANTIDDTLKSSLTPDPACQRD